ncbi:MAG: response regulator [Candidatus Eremiobacteraeota bacterium]|nr:response regulator [Candidatus Eremiobacteraeota bacterium]
MPLEETAGSKHLSRFLVVDDDPLFSQLAHAALSEAGHDVLHAATGVEALVQIEMSAPDLVILDCGLDGVSELNLMEEINRRAIKVGILVLSARRGPIHEQVMRSFGADYVLSKPISATELRDAINKLISQKRCNVL